MRYEDDDYDSSDDEEICESCYERVEDCEELRRRNEK
jgi:hypothetical protein